MKNLILGVIIMLLAACSSPTPEVKVIDTEVKANKPPAPTPVSIYDVKWKVIDSNVCLSAPDGVKLNTQSKELADYIKEMQTLVCYYEDSYGFCKD